MEVLGSPSLIIPTISVDVDKTEFEKPQSSGAVSKKKEKKMEVPSLIIPTVSVDVNRHSTQKVYMGFGGSSAFESVCVSIIYVWEN